MPGAPLARPRRALLAVIALCCAAPAMAGFRVAVPPRLREAATLCLGEALRLCPTALASADRGLSCIVGKRRLLSAPCRAVYDQGTALLRGGGLPPTLRRPGAR